MSKFLTFCFFVLVGLPLLALSWTTWTQDKEQAQVFVGFDDYYDYEDWKQEREEERKSSPFKPALIKVSGIGRVKSAPDVAVIVGKIKTEGEFDHIATDKASKIINAVQESIKGESIKISFTRISTAEQRDDDCLRKNNIARIRHRDIVNDNRYNQQLKRRKETKKTTDKPRPAKARIAQIVCPVTHIEAYLDFTAWVEPPNLAGEMINRFTTAGVTAVNLYGYDFSDYDALYKKASAQAVSNAKLKAETIAKRAGTKLTTLESFYIDRPQRTARYGPQAMVISNHGNRFVAAGRYRNTQSPVLAPAPMPVASYGGYVGDQNDEIIVTATKRSQSRFESNVTRSASYSKPSALSNTGNASFSTNAPAFAGNANNALKMTLLAGPQTVTVNAKLGYLYDTPLNGMIIVDDEP